MAPRFRTFLFDLDGTLIDHFAAIHRSHAHTLRRLGLPEPSPAAVRRAVGLGIEHAIAQLVGPSRADLVTDALPIYHEHWERTMLDDVELLPGARDLLESLHVAQMPAGVLTNKRGDSARAICAFLGIDRLLTSVIGALDTPWLKPRPELVAHALSQLAGEPATTLFIGDSPYDIQAARNAGLPCWCVTTGTHGATELAAAGATAVHADLASINAALVSGR